MSGDDEEWKEDPPWQEDLTPKKRASHIRHCSAYGCTSKGYRLLIAGERVQYFPFPLFDRVLCQRWASAIKLEAGLPFEKSYVCSKHFRPSDYKAKIYDESKKSLRRMAIPSLKPVVTPGKYKKDSSDDSEDESSKLKEITTLVRKEGSDGENITVLVVRAPGEENEEDDPVPELLQNKKVPVLCEDILTNGPPYPWPNGGLRTWLVDRLAYHEEQLHKVQEATATYEEESRTLDEEVNFRIDLLSDLVLKNNKGSMNLSKTLRQAVIDK